MEKRWLARGLGFVMGAAAGVSAVALYTTELMMSMALDRKMPGAARKAAGLIEGSPRVRDLVSRQKAAEEALREEETETVTIRSFDGLELVGHLARCQNPERLVIAVHGWRSSWASDFGMIAPFFRENGCNVLYVEQRGQQESGGDCMGFGLLERHDCVSWAQWADEQNFGLPIFLSGISMGATTVLMASGMGLPESVKGISADCGFTSPHAIWKHVVEANLHLPYTPMQAWLVDQVSRRKIHVRPDEYSTLKAMETNVTPILFVHGEKDTFVPPEMTRQNYEACKAPKRMVLVPEAGHGLSYVQDKEGCEKQLLEFWADCVKEA